MTTVLLDTDDLDEVEVVVSSAYFAKARLRTSAQDTPARTLLLRSTVGSLTIDDASVNCDLHYEMEPPHTILLCRFRAGRVAWQLPHHREPQWFCAGDVAAFGALDGAALDGEIRHAKYDILSIDRHLFNDVAAGPPSRKFDPVRLTGDAPVSNAAKRHMVDAIDYVCNTAAKDPFAAQSKLIASAVQQYLATSMLATFPHNGLLEPTIEDRRDTTPILLRRAIAFVDDNAHQGITITDIANHIYVTPRAVQLMFRKHRDCTPSEYLRKVRLHHAHVDLLAGDRMKTTVTEIAHRWGFTHVGRFAVLYREQYGASPHLTLRE